MEKLTIVKVGGKVVENEESLNLLIQHFAKIEGHKILVHGGGILATKLADSLGIKSHMVNGRRITDGETLDLVTMVYGGLVNKKIVAKLQTLDINALGLTGADLNCIRSEKRPIQNGIDYGFVGDVKQVNSAVLTLLINQNIVPVLVPITHDKNGQLLNTNADTIAGETAKALAKEFEVTLIYCFEKKGVLQDENNDDSVINQLNKTLYSELKASGCINGGMIPKLDNAFAALAAGVKEIVIKNAADLGVSKLGTHISE